MGGDGHPAESEQERDDWLRLQAVRIVCAGAENEFGRALGVLEGVGDRYDDEGVYLLCWALADIIRESTVPDLPVGDGSLTGGPLAVATVDGDPGGVWAARFMAAYLNGDKATTDALFYSALHDRPQAMRNVLTLIGMASRLARDAEQGMSDRGAPIGLVMLTRIVLQAAMDTDSSTTLRTMSVVIDDYGAQGVYDVCRAMADAVRVYGFPQTGDDPAGRRPGVVTAAMLPFHDSDEADDVWAAEFTVAHIAGDDVACKQMFVSAFGESAVTANQCLAALITLAGFVCSIARKQEQA